MDRQRCARMMPGVTACHGGSPGEPEQGVLPDDRVVPAVNPCTRRPERGSTVIRIIRTGRIPVFIEAAGSYADRVHESCNRSFTSCRTSGDDSMKTLRENNGDEERT